MVKDSLKGILNARITWGWDSMQSFVKS